MADTPIKKPPKNGVQDLSLKRKDKTNVITASWKVPSAATNDSDHRATGIYVVWVVTTGNPVRTSGATPSSKIPKKPQKKHTIKTSINQRVDETTTSLNLNNIVVERDSQGNPTKTLTRDDFYPMTSRAILSVECIVRLSNSYADKTGATKRHYGPDQSKSIKLSVPGRPSIAAFKHDEDTGRVTAEIKAYDGDKGRALRYDTQYQLLVTDSRYKEKDEERTPLNQRGSFTGDKRTVSWDARARYQLGYNNYIEVKCIAKSRGHVGDSDWTAWRKYYISYPHAVKITGVTCKSSSPRNKVTIDIRTNATTTHPTTGIRLQVLRNTPAKTQAEALGKLDDWQDTEIVDNGLCTALSVGVEDLKPDPGLFTWVRVKSWNMFEDKFYRYSSPKRIKALESEVEKFSGDKCGIAYAKASTDYAILLIGINPENAGTCDGIELQWSDNDKSWISSDAPDTHYYEETGSLIKTRAQIKESNPPAYYEALKTGNFRYGAKIELAELEPGTVYYLRARVKRIANGEETWSKTCSTATITTASNVDGTCAVISAVPQDGGLSAEVVVGINEGTANTGTEVSWSVDRNAWRSNIDPDTMSFTWLDDGGPVTDDKGQTWAKTTTVYLRGLMANSTYYIRARRYLDSGSTIYSTYSETATMATMVDESSMNNIAIISATPQPDGTSVQLLVGWTEDAANNGTEVGWSTNQDAWTSSEQPDMFQFDWVDSSPENVERDVADTFVGDGESTEYTLSETPTGAVTVTVGGAAATATVDGTALTLDEAPGEDVVVVASYRATTAWKATARVTVAGLDEGETYYFRARRYLQAETTTYTPWSSVVSAIPASSPSSVTLMVPGYVARGDGFDATWTFDSSAPQRTWELVTGVTEERIDTEPETIHHESGPDETEDVQRRYLVIGDEGRVVIASGTDANGAYSLDAGRIAALVTDDALPLAVRVSTGGDFVESEAHVVRVADPPTVSLDVPETLEAQPLEFGITSDAVCDLVVSVNSDGVVGEWPGGSRVQADGDTVWSSAMTPEWEASAGQEGSTVFTHTVTLPEGMDFWDLATYTVTVIATDRDTGLTGEVVTGEFVVGWSHQAPEVTDDIVITPVDETDDDGARSRRCEIALAESDGMSDYGDVYDVYRLTPDGPYLIAEGVAPGESITDPYAPFGGTEKGYRIATRTVDGDVDWADYEYALPGKGMRVDFGDDYVELPFNVAWSDSYSKDFEARAHIGQRREQGYWDDTVSRRSNLSTDLIKVAEQGKAAMLRRLAQHAGPCFVRTSDGCAYAANVDVGMSPRFRDVALAVTLDATEIDLPEEYMADVPLTEAENDDGGNG